MSHGDVNGWVGVAVRAFDTNGLCGFLCELIESKRFELMN